MAEERPRLISVGTNQLANSAQIGQVSIYRSRLFLRESLRLRPSRAAALDSTRNRSKATPGFGL